MRSPCSEDAAAENARHASSRACSSRSTTRPRRVPPRRSALRGARQLERSSGQQRPERLRLVELAPRPVGELELGEDRARLGRPGVLARPPELGRAARAAPRSRRARRRAGGRRAAARRCRSSGSPSGGRRRRAGPVRATRSSCGPSPNAIAEPASRPLWRMRKRRCLPSPTTPGWTASQPGTSSVTSGLPRPNGASRSSSAARPSVSAEPGDDRVDPGHGREVVLGEDRVGVRGEGGGERLQARRVDREAGGGAVAAEALQVLRAGGERAVQVEGGQRAARALPVAVGARDQHDRAG